MCPECRYMLSSYCEPDTGFIQSICWICGYYEDDSAAYRLDPKLFKEIVRERPNHFLKKFCHQLKGNTDNFNLRGNRTL